jgi:hypothetical protein
MMDDANRALPTPAAKIDDRKRGASLDGTGSLVGELENAAIAQSKRN